MLRHWSFDLLIIVTGATCLFTLHHDILSQYIHFADSCSPRWRDVLYYLQGMSTGGALFLVPFAFYTILDLTISFVDRFFPDNEQPEKAEP